MSVVDLPSLPQPDVIQELDYEQIVSDMAAQFNGLQPLLFTEELKPVLLEAERVTGDNGEQYFKVPANHTGLTYVELESDPTAKLIEIAAYREMLLRQDINDGALACMLAFATGTDLDNIAAFFDVKRLLVTPADPNAVPPVEAVYESDSNLRRRTQLAMDGFSVAGPKGSYVFHALSASAQVRSVKVDAPKFSHASLTQAQLDVLPANAIVLIVDDDVGLADPIPGDVAVTVLSTEGDGAADQPLLDAVEGDLSEEDIRPVTDNPRIRSAEIVNYSVDAELIMFSGPDASVALQAAIDNITKYVDDSREIGTGPTLAGIYAALKVAGVYDVTINSPATTPSIGQQQSAYCTGINVVIGGVHG